MDWIALSDATDMEREVVDVRFHGFVLFLFSLCTSSFFYLLRDESCDKGIGGRGEIFTMI